MKNPIKLFIKLLIYGAVIAGVIYLLWFIVSYIDVAAHNITPGSSSWLGAFNYFYIYF